MAGFGIITSTARTRPAAVGARDELLRDDRLQHERELRAHLRLLLRRGRCR